MCQDYIKQTASLSYLFCIGSNETKQEQSCKSYLNMVSKEHALEIVHDVF